MSAEYAVLLWIHIIGAVGWLGSGMVFGMLLGPLLPSLAPATRGELVVKLIPRYVRYSQVFSILTPIFGVGLALFISKGNFSIFNPANTLYGPFLSRYITAGAFLTVITLGVVFLMITPAANKVVKLTKEAMAGSAPHPQELQNATRQMRIFAAVALVLLLTVVALMIIADVGI